MSDTTTPPAAELEAAPAASREFVGFVGCPKAGLLKVIVSSKTAEVMSVACPRCDGETHTTGKAMARELKAGEVVTLVAEETPMQVDALKSKPNEKVTDEAIHAAIGADFASVNDIAEALGYTIRKGTSSALNTRLRRMNQRAQKAEEPEPFELQMVAKSAGGRELVVRRTVEPTHDPQEVPIP